MGSTTCRNVPSGVAYKSSDASTRLRSMPCNRARTSNATTAMLNSTCVAMTLHVPICRRNVPSFSSMGLITSKIVTKVISDEMPITMPGTKMAI